MPSDTLGSIPGICTVSIEFLEKTEKRVQPLISFHSTWLLNYNFQWFTDVLFQIIRSWRRKDSKVSKLPISKTTFRILGTRINIWAWWNNVNIWSLLSFFLPWKHRKKTEVREFESQNSILIIIAWVCMFLSPSYSSWYFNHNIFTAEVYEKSVYGGSLYF